MRKAPNHRISGRLSLLLLVLLLINPVILFLLSKSIWLSLVIPVVIIAASVAFSEIEKLKGLKTLWINVLLVLSFLLHSEAVFTYNYPEYIIEDLYTLEKNYYFNKPYLDKTFQDKEFLVQYKTNAQGFRIGAEDDPEITVGEADWLFIGDSYTQGAQVQYEELYTSKLNDHFPDKIILNAGISGLGLVDEYYYYVNQGKNLNASKVFLQICNFNDFMNVGKRSFGFSDYLMHHSNFARFVLYGFKYANPAQLPLGRWTEPFYPDEQSNIDYNIFYKKSSKIKELDIATFERYLQKFSEAVKANGGELILVQIPTKEQVHFKYFQEVLEDFELDIQHLDMHYPNKLLANLSSKYSIQHIDLLEDFISSPEPLFFDFDEHLNIQGHQQIAKSIIHSLPDSTQNEAVQMLSSINVGDRYPVIGKDQRMIFQSWRDGNMELFTSDTLMQSVQRITWNSVDEIHPWPSPKGDIIVFTEGDQASNRTKVGIMDTKGIWREHLTIAENHFGAIPSFDATGDQIAYAEWYEINNELTNPQIVIQDLTTGKKEVITSDMQESWRPIFSPCNTKLYYISKEQDGQFDIYEYSLSEGTTRNLTQSSYDEWDPAISRDGKTLIYAGHKDGNWDLFQLQLDTGEQTRLTRSKGDEWDPHISACGKYLYYAATYGLRNGIFRLPIQ